MPKAKTTSSQTSVPTQSLVNGVSSSPVQIPGGSPNHGAQIAPKLEINAPFLLQYHPHRWTCMADREGKVHLVPCPAKLKIVDGVQGIYRDRNGNIQWRDARPQVEQFGYTIIPTTADPVVGNYLRRTPVKGGFHHHTVWATAHAGANYFTTDVAAYAAFWGRLFEAGTIPLPPRHVFERMAEDLRPKILRAASRAQMDASLAAELKALQRQEAALIAALEKYEDAPIVQSDIVEI